MKKTIRILMALICITAMLCAGFATAEEAAATATPTATPAPTPTQEELGKLEFVIDGPDESMPVTIKYSDFEGGKYTLENLAPGTYTVTESDPDKLLSGYTFNAEASTTKIEIEVQADETSGDTLTNVYERTVEVTPTPSATPTASETPSPTPTATPTATPEPDGKISIPVTKIWDDYNNRDGNRPERVIVYLLANGERAGQAVLNAANGWSYTFVDMPQYSKGEEIKYTVTEEAVAMYTASYHGTTITNKYTPETTSVTVSKIWIDNDNAMGIRPGSIYCTLSNGYHVVLNAANGWTATVEGLPTIVNGKEVTYTWTEQEVIGYTQTGIQTSGTTTVFTNTIVSRGDNPPEGKKTPTKGRGKNFLIIEDYGTPLGVEVTINHVGDCFD